MVAFLGRLETQKLADLAARFRYRAFSLDLFSRAHILWTYAAELRDPIFDLYVLRFPPPPSSAVLVYYHLSVGEDNSRGGAREDMWYRHDEEAGYYCGCE